MTILGKRLMARCRQLHQENEDLGKMIASGKLSKLESELALQKNLTETFKQNEVEVCTYLILINDTNFTCKLSLAILRNLAKLFTS